MLWVWAAFVAGGHFAWIVVIISSLMWAPSLLMMVFPCLVVVFRGRQSRFCAYCVRGAGAEWLPNYASSHFTTSDGKTSHTLIAPSLVVKVNGTVVKYR